MILYAIYFYVWFGVSYSDLEEIMAERGGSVDHATLNRRVEKYAGAIVDEAHRRKGPTCFTRCPPLSRRFPRVLHNRSYRSAAFFGGYAHISIWGRK